MADESADSAPSRKKRARRKKKRRKDFASGPPRPTFARGYPRTDALDALVAAFDAGNFAYVREHAPKLARETKDDAERAAALDLRRRIQPEIASVLLVLLGISLLIFLYTHYLGHPG